VKANNGEPESRRRSGERWWPEQGKLSEKRCAISRACAREARGSARGPEEDVAAPKQEPVRRRRAWRHGEARGAAVRRGGRMGETAQGREGGGKARK
jgi:hypothetical protein